MAGIDRDVADEIERKFLLDRLPAQIRRAPDAGTAERFEPPAWFGREVTGESAYKNQSLACHGRPTGADRWATS
jgi:CYTH domain-containing protein